MSELDDDYEHPVGELLRRHYAQRVSPEVAARHTMAIHREAARIRLDQRRAVRTARRPRRAVVASLVGAMVVGSASGAFAASEESVPGQVLYPVKRAGEQARLLAATPFRGQAEVHLLIASHRVEEVAAVGAVQPRLVPDLVEQAQVALQAATREGAPEPEVEQVETTLVAAATQAELAPEELDRVTAALATPSPTVQTSPVPSPSVNPSDVALGAGSSATPGVSPGPSGSTSTLPGVPPLPETATVSASPAPSPSPSPSLIPPATFSNEDFPPSD